jgi:hypothetical protein
MKRLAIFVVTLAIAIGVLARPPAHATTVSPHLLSFATLRQEGLSIMLRSLTMQHPEQTTNGTPTTTQTLPPTPPTSTTPTATPTPPTPPTATPTPFPTATPTRYPDPVQILQAMQEVFSTIHYVHYTNPVSAELAGVAIDSFKATGNGNDKQPAFTAHVVATHKDEIGNATTKSIQDFIVIKKTAYAKAPFTHKRWQRIKLRRVCVNFHDQLAGCVLLDNPLPNASQTSPPSSGSGGGPVPKDLQNLGPESFHGVAVWHLHFTLAGLSSGVSGSEDILVSRAKYLPIELKITLQTTKAKPQQKLQEALIYSKFNHKFVVKAPKVGTK